MIIALAVAALGLWLRLSLPQLDGRVEVAGLEASVTIVRDAWGIPHIIATSADDAYFGLGYAHAQDRLFQMEQQRRLAQGRLSELLGSSTLEFDRFLRTLGLYRAAEESVDALDPEARAALESYAAGVNAFMASHRGALAPELALLLADDPEPWRPADSIAWLKVMGLHLSGNWRDEVLRARMVELLGSEMASSFFPPHPPDASVILEEARLPAGDWSDRLLDLLPRSGNGSNNWVVDGRHTSSGLPMLANDPHLGFSIPAVWYLAHLEAPGLDVVGATLPGMPIVIVGANERIAWGVTNTGPDTQDLFLERLDPEDASRYLTPGGSEPFALREETVAVRFGEDVAMTVRETRHGPVISDVADDAAAVAGDNEVVALAWTLLAGDDRTMQAGLALHTAAGWPDFVAAARDYLGPQQNIVYADRRGNIGMISPALIPIRRGGEGLLPSPGWTGEGDWIGAIPFHELPRLRNPASGMIATANERLVGDDYPYLLGHDWQPGFRGDRIRGLLRERRDHDLASFRAIQTDELSLFAVEMLPIALAGEPQTTEGRALKAALAGWDGTMAADEVAPTVFEAWYRELSRALYADETGELFGDAWWFHPIFVRAVFAGEAGPWCDDVTTPETTETCEQLAGLAFDRAAAFLDRRFGTEPEDRLWGDVHAIALRHRLFGLVPGLADLTGVDLRSGGSRFTVAAGGYVFNDDERVFRNVHGPVLRAIVTPGEPDGARFVILPGQSGNPLSPYYANMTQRWRDGDPIPIPLDSGQVEATHRLVLEPLATP